ncbi:flavodoxin family protein [Chloroflexota bacterium]
MKILAICGSPKKGNCYSVLNSIQENFPAIDYKLLMLNEVNLERCKGCYVCVLRGEEFCPLKDDRDMIIQEISDADGIILASPVHVNHISALMKQFIDRLGFLAHRPRFFNKCVMAMAIGGGFGADKANEYMSGMFSVFGLNVVSSLELYIASKAERDNPYNHEKTINAVNTLIDGIKKGQGNPPAPTMLKLIYFNIFKAIAELNKKEGPADYEFYKDKTDYVYDTKINPFKKMMAKRIAGKEIAKMMKDR